MPPGPSPQPEQKPSGEKSAQPAPTPFDNPWLLPVLLTGFALYFAYDGWFNPKMEWIRFNRIGAGILALFALWSIRGALRERSLQRENSQRGSTGSTS